MVHITFCLGFGYTSTSVNHEGQQDAQAKIAHLTKTVSQSAKCNDLLRPFLCLAFAPKCRKRSSFEIRPCQPACRL